MIRTVLVGNPNCGKTTVFNALTGARQRVGNWPGVTVEKKVGAYRHGDQVVEVTDLPGLYDLDAGGALDEQIAQQAIRETDYDVAINVVDASSLARGLYLTSQLMETSRPVVVALNMMDSADAAGIHIDPGALAGQLGCPVVALVASRGEGIGILEDVVDRAYQQMQAGTVRAASGGVAPGQPRHERLATPAQRFDKIDGLVGKATRLSEPGRRISDRIDAVALHRIAAIPVFLAVMYAMFVFSINIGGAFIDFFDLLGAAIFVELPRQWLTSIGVWPPLVAFVADGIGGGIALVGTFIPIIAALFLFLSFLEDSGYMARIAFVVDRALTGLGLPGKSFVPLIVGFGCNVPAVMATRTLDNAPDRILTTLMAPFMSCGARLTVYALFAAAFFPTGGQNIVFALYLIGIAVAVLSALIVRKHLLPGRSAPFVMELPSYHLPTAKGVLIHTWQRLKGFVIRAGKAIVIVVVLLNVLDSVGTDGSIGNQNSDASMLSSIGRAVTPLFEPIGIQQENWPATVGIFTGIFAKEVVVGTLDALYSPANGGPEPDPGQLMADAFRSIPENLASLSGSLADPLGLNLGDLNDTEKIAQEQAVSVSTFSTMKELFGSSLAAFSYLIFILLYMPCVATVGAIIKELGGFWATFSTLWSFVVAYSLAALWFQVGRAVSDSSQITDALLTGGSVTATCVALFWLLIRFGKQPARASLIPTRQLP